MGGKARVLVVDDEPGVGRLFRDVLERQGYETVVAQDGLQALRFAQNQRFDLVFLDLCMPGLDGVTTLKYLKHHNPDINVVIITGHGSTKQITESLERGAAVCLMKPLSIAQIRDTVALFTEAPA
ncbi:MAG TPA: response regulator [Armatimonadetes bacterium]|nr:response regulator [Armatimonadota bacterium]